MRVLVSTKEKQLKQRGPSGELELTICTLVSDALNQTNAVLYNEDQNHRCVFTIDSDSDTFQLETETETARMAEGYDKEPTNKDIYELLTKYKYSIRST